MAVSNEHAEIDLSKKFGALNSEASGLLRLVKQYSKKPCYWLFISLV